MKKTIYSNGIEITNDLNEKDTNNNILEEILPSTKKMQQKFKKHLRIIIFAKKLKLNLN